MTNKRNNIRNIAIIAHVDHGKTTLVDEMLKQSGTITATIDRVMDSGDIEKERGITILAKNTSIKLPNMKINIVDTPGHMDFGGEVERTLQMVEGFLLLVDAAEGPLPGTKFVLKKALQLNLKPIVIINKIDRKDADIQRVESMIHDLFLDLATTEEQLEFHTLYGSSKNGFFSEDPDAKSGNMQPLFDAICKYIPAPKQTTNDLRLLITNLDYSDYLGRIGIGKVISGSIKLGKQVICCKDKEISKPLTVTKIYQFEGLNKVECQSAQFGDIVAITGFEKEISIGTTICDVNKPQPIKYVDIDEPTISIFISANKSPFAGKEGIFLTSQQIKERLFKELKTNVALRVENTNSTEAFKVSGRGVLHLGILIETMRREGFELEISAPQVIFKEIDEKKYEPMELLILDIEEEHQGIVMELLGNRKAELQNLIHTGNKKLRLEFKIPSRGIVGFRTQFIRNTRGTGLMNQQFHGFEPYCGEIPRRTKGSLISIETNQSTGFALDSLQSRGTLFVKPAEKIYCGMIVGEHSRNNDLDVNPTKKKKLTNMRASGSDDAVKLAPPKTMTLEESMEWINSDELIEVTPKSIRLRKKFLNSTERKRNK
ncbi:MAG: translational GTPase TypA [bacterium]